MSVAGERVIAAAARRRGAARGFEQTCESLALYRIAYAAWTLFVLGPTRMGVGVTSGLVAQVPDEMFHPPLGPAMLLPGWPPGGFVLVGEVALLAALGCVLVGAWTRTASLVVAACGLALSALLYSLGKVDHGLLWTAVVPVAMAWTSWGDRWSVDASRARVRRRAGFREPAVRPIQVVALLTGITFAAAAAVKASTGWLDPSTSAVLGWSFAQQAQLGQPVTAPALMAWTPSLLWPAADYATVAFEAAFLVAALRRSWLLPYLLVAVAFHLGAWAVGFPGFLDIAVVYLLFVRLDGIAARLKRGLAVFERFASARPNIVLVTVGATLTLVVAATFASGGPVTLLRVAQQLTVPLELAVWPAVLLVGGVALGRRTVRADRAGERLPPWAPAAGAAVVGLQLACTVWVSEPFPAPVGPLFMGSPDTGREIVVLEQRFTVSSAAVPAETPVDRDVVLPVGQSAAVQFGAVRFPAPYLDASGGVDARPGLLDQLAAQYHHFSSRHLPGYGGPLSAPEAAWLRGNLAAGGVACAERCTLHVQWYRLAFDRDSGRQTSARQVDRRDLALDR